MALIQCPECGNYISDKAPMCPRCGYTMAQNIMPRPQQEPQYYAPQQQPQQYPEPPKPKGVNKGLIAGIIVAAAVLIAGIALLNKGKSNQQYSASASYEASTEVEAVAVDSAVAVEATSPAPAPEPTIDLSEDGNYHLTGNVAGVACTMDITINGGAVYGSYYYNKYHSPLDLSGSKSGTFISLTESDKYGNDTGELSGHINGNTFSGSHYNYDKDQETRFSFKAK